MKRKTKPKVVVGLSGGVDSASALLLLKKQDFEPVGVSLKFGAWDGENLYANKDSFEIAKKVCQKLKVPYRIIDCRKEFKEKVIGYFLKELKNKRTPNPCVVCNHQLKFKKLLDFAKKNKIEYVATGHYARIKKVCHCERLKGAKQSQTNSDEIAEPVLSETKDLGECLPRNDNFCEYQLLKGKDKIKDQSYFLCLLSQKELKHIIFPLGDLTKEEVCRLAEKEGLNFVAKRKPSQDLCFIDNKSLPLLLEKEIGLEPGKIIDGQGNVLGEHQGLHFYTIGQRKGLDISKGPWWVIGFNKEKNELVVANQEKDIALFSKTAIIFPYYFISGQEPKKAIKVKVKCRYGQLAASATLTLCHFCASLCHSRPDRESRLMGLDSRFRGNDTKGCVNDTERRNIIKITFSYPQKAVTPGQWAVFYQKDVCLGGGIIQARNNEQ
jgi:tRNA-specific 2-thiouridylase